MVKKKAARKGGKNASKPPQNQTAASSSNIEPPARRPTSVPPRVIRLIPPTGAVQQPATSPPEAAAVALDADADADDGFELVRRRGRAVRSHFERRTVSFAGDVQQYTPTRYSSDRRLNAYLNYLFARLDEAVHDTRLDFEEILEEIDRFVGLQPSTPVGTADAWDTPDSYGGEVSGGDASGWQHASGWRDDVGLEDPSGWEIASGWGETSVWDDGPAPARPSLAISIDNEEHFPELGAPHRRGPNHASSSSQGRQLPWSAIAQPRPLPAPHVSRIAPTTPTQPPQHLNIPPKRSQETPPKTPPIAKSAELSPLDLRKLAEDASVLLELYSKTEFDSAIDAKKQLIDSAFASVAMLNRHHRVVASSRHGASVASQKRPENDDFTVDAGCIICYSEFADTVLLPCHHLVLCALCCDMMGMKGKNEAWAVKVPCPMCRTHVVDRIKIFR